MSTLQITLADQGWEHFQTIPKIISIPTPSRLRVGVCWNIECMPPQPRKVGVPWNFEYSPPQIITFGGLWNTEHFLPQPITVGDT